MSDEALLVPVIFGSVRAERQGIRAARFFVNALRDAGCRPVLVDPLEKRLPLLDRMYKEYPPDEAPPVMRELADLYVRADGFCIVSGEYNHGIPPALKNLLDHFLEEYAWRPAAIVCYSGRPIRRRAGRDATAHEFGGNGNGYDSLAVPNTACRRRFCRRWDSCESAHDCVRKSLYRRIGLVHAGLETPARARRAGRGVTWILESAIEPH
ncbi:MAG: NAD(P)H-dependent oxidoreductase [Candidatus Eremiobacteraeota bacterium]|nr:NAD(P)H-dependent oxidoreductase [Candidatus Eremiobacteraeota bacterium]